MTEHTDQNQDAEQERALDMRAANEARTASPHADEPENLDVTLETELTAARAEAAEMRDRFLRTRAEMDNFRKRIERSYSEQNRSQTKRLLSKLLGVKDNLERALQYGSDAQNGKGIIEGVQLTLYQLEGLLEQEGVKVIDAEGRAFDPRVDEAIHSVDDPNVDDQTVVQVVRRGYTYGDEVLRPAQVVVSVHA